MNIRSLLSRLLRLEGKVSTVDNEVSSKLEGAESLGTGNPIYFSTVDKILNFRSLRGGDGITLSGTATEVTITSDVANVKDLMSVKDFGAIGDGVADDTAAFQTAFNNSNNRAIFIPAGSYRIEGDITATTRLVLVGESMTHSTLMFYNGARIAFSPGTQNTYNTTGQLGVYKLRFMTETNNQQSCFNCTWVGGSGGTSYTVTAEDCDFVGMNDTSGWRFAFELQGARNTSFRNIRVMGDRNSSTIQCAGGFRFYGATNGVEHKLLHCQVYFVKDAFLIEDTTEGVYITNCAAIKTLNGVVARSNGVGNMEPLIVIKGFHANVHQLGVSLKNYVQSFITDSLIYLHADYSSLPPSEQTGVYLFNDSVGIKSDVTFHDNQLWFINGLFDSVPKTGCYIDSGKSILVHHNMFSGFTRGVVVPSSGDLFISDNHYHEVTYKVTTPVGTTSAKLRNTPVLLSTVIQLPTSGSTGRINIPLPIGTVNSKPTTVVITPGSNPVGTQFYYGFDDSASTKDNISIRLVRESGSFSGGAVRLGIMLHEDG